MAEPDYAQQAAQAGGRVQGVRRLLDLRMYDRALGRCQFLLASDPDSAEVHQLAGIAALALKDLKAADRHLQTALANDPEDADTLFYLSRLWQDRGFPRLAEEAIERAITLNPHAAAYWGQWSWVNYREGDFMRARDHARKACELRADDPKLANLLALAESQCEDGTKYAPELQVQHLRELLAMDPEDSVLHHNLGVVFYEELGDYAQAARHFAAAAELDPTEKASRAMLVRALKRQDRFLKWVHFPSSCGPTLKRLVAVAHHQPLWWVLYVPLAVGLLVPALLVLGFWAAWLWPVGKGYEYLTVAEMRRQTNVFGGAGFLGVHRWPLALRLTLFLVLLTGFWAVLVAFWHVETVRVCFGLVVGLMFVEWRGLSIRDALRELRDGWRQ